MSRLLRQRARREAIFFLTPKNYFSFFPSHSTFGSLLQQSGHQRLESNVSRTAQDYVVGLRIIVNVITVVETCIQLQRSSAIYHRVVSQCHKKNVTFGIMFNVWSDLTVGWFCLNKNLNHSTTTQIFNYTCVGVRRWVLVCLSLVSGCVQVKYVQILGSGCLRFNVDILVSPVSSLCPVESVCYMK